MAVTFRQGPRFHRWPHVKYAKNAPEKSFYQKNVLFLGLQTAANDPIFWLLHCFVDRVDNFPVKLLLETMFFEKLIKLFPFSRDKKCI